MKISAEVMAEVKAAIAEREEREKQKIDSSFYEYIVECLKDLGLEDLPIGCAFPQDVERGYGNKPYHITSEANIKIFPLYANTPESYFVCFDMNRIEPGDNIKLHVPLGMEGYFIGRFGKNVKYWCSKLKIANISVVGW